ncbi:MAG: excinuclease ABC subunit UvrA [Patescibacteria group bacterium]
MAQGDEQKYIKVRGAKVHNLKNINVDIPKNKLVVITGLSGSGKSSLAFDTIYAEAERRFVESLSSYARQFLGVKEKPDVESITGLSPSIAIDQKSISRNPRSTVGTITEIYDYLRILFARAGIPHCPKCGKKIGKQSADEILRQILSVFSGKQIAVLAPIVRGKKGEHKGVLEEVQRGGFLRIRIDGDILKIEDSPSLSPKKNHSIEVVVDRLSIDKEIDRPRLRESLEIALKIGKGLAVISAEDKDFLFSESLACPECGISVPALEPRLFSFNSPFGACKYCTGLGSTMEVDPGLVVPNQNLTLAEGAIRPWAPASTRSSLGGQSWYWWMLSDLAEKHKFSLNSPFKSLPLNLKKLILLGDSDAPEKYEGVVPNLKRRWKDTESDWTREEIEKYMKIETCPECQGKRLRKEALGVTFGGKNIAQICEFTISEAGKFFKTSTIPKALEPLFKEISRRLNFLLDVGLVYLTLERSSLTLSGGEAQRVRLATQIGSSLTGVIYVLDEPSIGLHPRDHERLIDTLKSLRDLGNTVLVVEHDEETMKESDWILDLGPGAGKHGGEVTFSGTPKEILKAKTLTGEYLSRKKEVKIDKGLGAMDKEKNIIIFGAKEHNLKNVDVKIPLGKFVVVSGVSGSGKSSLVDDILARSLLKYFYGSKEEPGRHEKIEGLEHIDKAVLVDQSPIGRTPRSNPATYTGVFGHVREIFARTVEARSRGYKTGRFSFNVKGGRCEVCEGQGTKKIEMYFLPDIYVECEECRGQRYNREALEILYENKNIADVLALSIEEAHKFFKDIPQIEHILCTIVEVGLGYMKLGQPATTLSGGEAQRVKLAFELSKKATGNTLYILDEPTTGLHFDDIKKLLKILRALVDNGNSVVVIEHNMDVLKNADWIIDMGPEGGEGGGKIIAEGSPEEIAKNKISYTAKWLAKT